MKFSKKLFIVFGLVALLTGLFASTAFAGGIKTKGFAVVDKYAVLSNQPLTIQFKGHLACDQAMISGSVSGKSLYVSILDTKNIGGGKPCDDSRSKSYTRQFTFSGLVPGVYTVYVNADGSGKWQKKFKVVAPLYPTPTPAKAAGTSPSATTAPTQP
jgi:hypothetical protein